MNHDRSFASRAAMLAASALWVACCAEEGSEVQPSLSMPTAGMMANTAGIAGWMPPVPPPSLPDCNMTLEEFCQGDCATFFAELRRQGCGGPSTIYYQWHRNSCGGWSLVETWGFDSGSRRLVFDANTQLVGFQDYRIASATRCNTSLGWMGLEAPCSPWSQVPREEACAALGATDNDAGI
jgi:hypothetical protein